LSDQTCIVVVLEYISRTREYRMGMHIEYRIVMY